MLIFLFASVDTIEIEGSTQYSLSGERALEIAERRGLYPVLVNYRADPKIGIEQGDQLVRYVGVAYLGNIFVMVLCFSSGLVLRTRWTGTS